MTIVLIIIGSLCWYAAGFINGMLYENRRFKKEIQALKEWFDNDFGNEDEVTVTIKRDVRIGEEDEEKKD